MKQVHDSVIGGCVREGLIADAKTAGRKIRDAIRRGDISANVAWETSSVGYPYMTASEYTAAKAAFLKATR
jgi:hypothetical protein